MSKCPQEEIRKAIARLVAVERMDVNIHKAIGAAADMHSFELDDARISLDKLVTHLQHRVKEVEQECELLEQEKNMLEDDIEPMIARNKRLREALEALQRQALQSELNNPAHEWGQEALAMTRAALTEGRLP